MSNENKALKWALEYAKAGYLVFPCKPGTKMPATPRGLHDATTDEDRIIAWWSERPGCNIGIACGPQPNGVNLWAIDVDAHKGGMDAWNALPQVSGATPIHFTPNGGLHLFFDAPSEFRNTRNRLGDGIDTRGAGGYVVVPPSTFPVGGDEGVEVRAYHTTRDSALVYHRPEPAPRWLLELAESEVDRHDPPQRDRVAGPPVGDADESPADYLRRVGDWPTALVDAGWTHDKGEYWVRPGKSVREGHSAVLHEGGPLVIFTTEIPPQLERLGTPTADRTGVSVSLFDFICAYRYGGDRAEAGREIRRQMPGPGRLGGTPAPAAADTNDEEGDLVGQILLNLPSEFWDQRPILAQIRDAAWSRLVSPDALLVNALARSATLIPPTLKLPPVVGSDATFDFLGCVVAETSGGKSITAGVAKDIVADPQESLHFDDRSIMFDLPVGSGEGIAQAFMVPEYKEDEDGKRKPTGRQIVGKQALHLVVDESTGLVAQARREGTTIIQTLLSAWSGQTLGQTNAKAETRRIVQGGRCRVTAVLNMQSSNAWMLFTDEMTTLGLLSRMLFSSAHDPNVPDDLPVWPGPLDWEVPPLIHGGQYMDYAPAISAQIVAERKQVLKAGVVDKATGHTSLLRCKVAAILAIWDGRRLVDVSDWALAGQVTDMSAAVVAHLRSLRASQVKDQRHSTALMRGESEAVVETAKERRLIADLAQKIIGRIPDSGTVGRRELARTMTSSKTRHRFDAALDLAVQMGRLKVTDGTIERL